MSLFSFYPFLPLIDAKFLSLLTYKGSSVVQSIDEAWEFLLQVEVANHFSFAGKIKGWCKLL